MNKFLIMLTLIGLILMSGCIGWQEIKNYCVKKCAEKGYGYESYIGDSVTKLEDIECICDPHTSRVIIKND